MNNHTWFKRSLTIFTLAVGLAGLVHGSEVSESLGEGTSGSKQTQRRRLVSLTVLPEHESIKLELTQQYTAIGVYSDGSIEDLTTSVTWQSSNTSIVNIETYTGLATGVGLGTAIINALLGDVASNNATLVVRVLEAYVVNYGNNTVSICSLNADGSIATPCDVTTAEGTLDGPANMVISPIPTLTNRTYAYITNIGTGFPDFGGTTITICPIHHDGSFGTDCTTSTGNGTFNQPNGITINADNTMLYVANGGNDGTNNISLCPIQYDGSLGTCTTNSVDGTLNNPNGITLNSANTFAYITNYYANTITICPLNSDGTFGPSSSCIQDPAGSTLNGPIDVKINAANTFAYITNLASNTVSICPVMGDGSFGATCTTSTGGGSINGPAGLILDPANTHIYIANNNNNEVTICSVMSDGTLTDCTFSIGGGSFNEPNDVFIH